MQPANKTIIEGGFEPFGIMVWQGVVTLLLAGAVAWKYGAPKGQAQWLVCIQIAVLGTLIPHFSTFTAVAYLPAGVMAIILSTIPVFALALSLFLGREVLTWRLGVGLCLGLGAMTLIALSRGDLAGGVLWAIFVGLLAPLCYALNATILGAGGMAGLHPMQAFAGAAALFLPVSMAAALAAGQMRGLTLDVASFALLGTAVGHTLIYAGYLWLVTQAGAVFASQTAYLVTGFGIFWSMLLLGERYGFGVWIALGMMFVGLTLVRPSNRTVAPARATGETAD